VLLKVSPAAAVGLDRTAPPRCGRAVRGGERKVPGRRV